MSGLRFVSFIESEHRGTNTEDEAGRDVTHCVTCHDDQAPGEESHFYATLHVGPRSPIAQEGRQSEQEQGGHAQATVLGKESSDLRVGRG